MADQKAPDLTDAFIYDLAFLLRLPVAEIRRPVVGLLKARSLHIVSEAERKVLAECARAEIGPACHRGIQCCAQFKGNGERYVCTAELARRSGT